jgi:hypothetical protein
MILKGTEYKKIQQQLGINESTWSTWVHQDYQGFRQFLTNTKKERLIAKAEKISEEIFDVNLNDKKIESKYGKVKLTLMKEKLNEAHFILETLGKSQGYSKRQELTGADGGEIRIASIVFAPPIMSRAELLPVREAEFINTDTPKEELQDAMKQLLALQK